MANQMRLLLHTAAYWSGGPTSSPTFTGTSYRHVPGTPEAEDAAAASGTGAASPNLHPAADDRDDVAGDRRRRRMAVRRDGDQPQPVGAGCHSMGPRICGRGGGDHLHPSVRPLHEQRRAYWLVLAIRAAIPKVPPLARAEFATIRLRLLKLAARISETTSRIRIAFAAACPEAALFRSLASALCCRPP
jgi:Transposase DDE domain group 1